MAAWLRKTTWFQRIALVLFVVTFLMWLVTWIAGDESAFGPMLGFAFLAFLAFRRQILWRVRNRLVITFLLFGVVPLFLIYTMAQLSAVLLLSQFAGSHVEEALQARMERVHMLARNLAQAPGNAALLEEIRKAEPRLTVIERGGPVPTGAPLREKPPWLGADFHGLFGVNDREYLGAVVTNGNGEVFAFLPFDQQTFSDVSSTAVIAGTVLDGDINIGYDSEQGSKVSIRREGQAKQEIGSSLVPRPRNSWDKLLGTIISLDTRVAPGETKDLQIVVQARASRLLAGAFSGPMASVVVSILVIVGGVLLVVELVALVSTFSLTRAITRSVDDLHKGTLRVAGGDFTTPIPVRGRHQLSALAESFNSMTAQIRHYIGEMRKKDKLEGELEIARQVQSRLFPRTVPEIPTLELAGVCQPGRYVSGDYYDFVRLDDRYTAIVLGDVAGKGVSAALLMASIQSSLHAQLKFSGAATEPSLSTATLMGLISQQLYENTPPEKYATFFCSVYDNQEGVLRYTNCGHLKPIVVRGGAVSTLEGDGMVVGLMPQTTYEHQQFAMQPGDLIAIFSDGIPEAENAQAEEFGEARLGELLAQHAREPLDTIIQTVTAAVDAFAADPEARDDTTLVLLRNR